MKGWALIAAFIKTGLIAPRFHLSEKERLQPKAGLNAIVRFPLIEINLSQFNQEIFINCFTAQNQSLIKLILENVQILTFKHLLTNLEKCCHTLFSQLQDKPYHVAVILGKSQAWIADLSYRYLPIKNLPKSVIEIGKITDKNKFETLKFNLDKLIALTNGNVVLFDDVSYTGKQLLDFIKLIEFKLKNTQTKLHLYLVLPFMSKLAKKTVLNAISSSQYSFQISLITEYELNNVLDMTKTLTSPQVEKLYQLLDSPSVSPKIPALSNEKDAFAMTEISQKCLCFTEWKKPDNVSLPKLFGTTEIAPDYLQNGLTKLPTLIKEVSPPYK
jgi:hypothetical protein